MEEKELSTTISASPVNSESDAAAVTQPNDVVFAHNDNNTTTTGGVVVSSAITTSFSGTERLKRGRGRPRKYDSDGNLVVSFNSSSSNNNSTMMTSPRQTTPFSVSSGDQFSSSSSAKRGRGRPSGSGNWQILASLGEIFANTAGGDFTPHVVTVGTGEDVGGKILSFAEKGPRGICVLSANGTVSNVTIRQPGSSGGILTYEGRFEILSLSGSFTVTEISGGRSRTGSMSVSLAGPDGRVIGGSLAGLLTAATPIQIVVGSFMPNGYKIHKRKYHRSEQNVISPTQPNTLTPETTVTFANPISQSKPPMVVHDTPEPLHPTPPPPPTTTTTTAFLPPQQLQNVLVLGGDQENPKNNGTTNNSNGHGASTPHFVSWNGSDLHGHRSPDINISVPGDL